MNIKVFDHNCKKKGTISVKQKTYLICKRKPEEGKKQQNIEKFEKITELAKVLGVIIFENQTVLLNCTKKQSTELKKIINFLAQGT